ncbi:MAG: 30S ribosomal protein S17e [Candidatus Nanohaloarchaea archaeon]|nr:30S ribosomal protein S17e [Candidatus Nanohaloarchaea archaeon]
MGRVRPKHVKRLSRQLVEEHEDRFTEDFDHNKEELKEMDFVESKKLRNRVAGYIVRVLQNKKF